MAANRSANRSASRPAGRSAGRSPAQIQRWLDKNLHRFDLPSQMLGDEPNARRKNWAPDPGTEQVRWCMVASWTYEAAAGNSSVPAVYCAVNDGAAEHLCDRFYLPATPRDLRLLEREGIGAFGIESKHPLRDFDVVGSSISYPVLAMSYVKLLTVSGIPARWRERAEAPAGPGGWPMVIVGGQCYGAPEALAPVVDCWWLGEVEDEPGNPGITDVCARIAAFKADGSWTGDRIGCYAALARQFNFLYFPRFLDVHYGTVARAHGGSKQVVGYPANLEGMRLPFTRRYVKNLDNAAPLSAPPLLYSDPAMGSGDLEVGRGCPAWCSFCALTYRQKPYRQRSVDNVLGYAEQFARNMGSVRMAPFSPDFPMYTQRKKLSAGLLERVSDEVDAATMRVDDFIADDQFILLQVHGGMDAVTLGVEGNSQRMRDLVGKGTSDADIIDAVARGIRAGIRRFKLYLITNLPGEDEGDIFRVLKLAKDLADVREQMNQPTVRIQLSWTPLMIEANTPFQWFAPTQPSRLLTDVWDALRDLKIDFKIGAKAEENRFACFQACQRASRAVGEALVDVMTDLDQACWGGVPRHVKALLADKLRERGFTGDYADIFDERARADMFGWEFIDQGISAEMLWVTYMQMKEFLEQTDSHTYDLNFDAGYHGNEWIERCDTRCYGKTCGACDHADLKIRTGYIRAAQTERHLDLSTLQPVDQASQAMRIRARLHRGDAWRWVDNSHWRFALRRAAFRAQHTLHGQPDDPLAGAGITKRSIRFASDEIRHRDWTAGVDYVEFGLTRRTDPAGVAALLETMQVDLAPRLHLGDWVTHPAGGISMRADVDLHLYELPIDDDPAAVTRRLHLFAQTATVAMRLPVVGGYFAPATEVVNARDHVDALWLARHGATPMLRMLVRGRPSPYQIYAAVMGRPSWIDAAAAPAARLDAFVAADRAQADFLRPNCDGCGLLIPVNLLDQPYTPTHCPRCADAAAGRLLTLGDPP